jgi:predicted small metal-binding protein
MGKSLDCRDLGFDCGFEVRADNEEQILQAAGVHAQQVHGLDVTPELVTNVTSVIKG